MSCEYGNARLAARRARLLDRAALERLAASGSAAEFHAALERQEDWRTILRGVAPLGVDAGQAIDAAIERHRSERLAALPPMYEAPERRLVEALVLPLDVERALAVLRRRHAGETAEAIGATIVGGALLGAADLGRLARAGSEASAVRVLVAAGLVTAADATALAEDMARSDAWERFEAAFAAAAERARRALARGRGPNAAAVRAAIDGEGVSRLAIAEAVAGGGMAAGALIERSETLARLAGLARGARRDPLGIGVVIAYVAAVESQAVRLRAALARIRAGWTADLARPYLGWGAT